MERSLLGKGESGLSLAAMGAAPEPGRISVNDDVARRHRVLVAEDDEAMRQLLAIRLRSAGIGVDTVCNGEQLTRRIEGGDGEQQLPAVVITALGVPGGCSLKTLRKLTRERWGVPVILITSFGDESSLRRARQLGAVTVLEKPFDIDELVTLVDHLVTSRSETCDEA